MDGYRTFDGEVPHRWRALISYILKPSHSDLVRRRDA